MKELIHANMGAFARAAPGFELRFDHDDSDRVSVSYRKGEDWWQSFMIPYTIDTKDDLTDPVRAMSVFMGFEKNKRKPLSPHQRIEEALRLLKEATDRYEPRTTARPSRRTRT